MNAYLSPNEIAEHGEKLYQEKIKSVVEPTHVGKFLAVEIESGEYCLSETAEQALRDAKERFPDKIFHLIRVGYPGAFAHSRLAGTMHAYGGLF